jgi:hypothetical protein
MIDGNEVREEATIEVEPVKLKIDPDAPPYFQLTACHYQLEENGPWYVGVIVNDSDMILTRSGKLLTAKTLHDIELDEDMLVMQLGPIIKYIEGSSASICGRVVSTQDPIESIRMIKDMEQA